MKKFISMLLALVMVFALTACGGSAEPTEAPTEMPTEAPTEAATEAPETEAPTEAPVEDGTISEGGTLDALLNQVVTEQPVEFMGGIIPVDVTDTSEDGLASLKYFTGLDNADQISEAAVYEPMIGSIAFSMVMVRVNEGEDAEAVAEAMKNGIDTRKWICVEAENLMVAGYGDVVMLIMCDNAQPFVDAFQTVCGGELDFVI